MSSLDGSQTLDTTALQYASTHHLHELIDALISEVAEKQPSDPIACMIDFVQARLARKAQQQEQVASLHAAHAQDVALPSASAANKTSDASLAAARAAGDNANGDDVTPAATATSWPLSLQSTVQARLGRMGVWYHIHYADLATIAHECRAALRARWPSPSSADGTDTPATAAAASPHVDNGADDNVPLELMSGDVAALLPRLAAAAEAEHVSGLAHALRLVPLSPHRNMAAALDVVTQVVLAHAPLATPSQASALVQFMQHVGQHLQDSLMAHKDVLMREAWCALRGSAAAWQACDAHARATLCYLEPLLLLSSSVATATATETQTTVATAAVASGYDAFVVLLDRVAEVLPSWPHVEVEVAAADVSAVVLPPDQVALYGAVVLHSIERTEGGVWCAPASVRACELVVAQLLRVVNTHVQYVQRDAHTHVRLTDEKALAALLHFARQCSTDVALLSSSNSSSSNNNSAQATATRMASGNAPPAATTTLAHALRVYAAYSEEACDAFCRVAAEVLRGDGDAARSHSTVASLRADARATSTERLLMRCKAAAFRHVLGVLFVLMQLRRRVSVTHAQQCVVRCLVYGVPFADLYVRYQDAFDAATRTLHERDAQCSGSARSTLAVDSVPSSSSSRAMTTRKGALQMLSLLQHVCQSMVTHSSFAQLTQSLRVLTTSVALPNTLSAHLCTTAPQAAGAAATAVTALTPEMLARCLDVHGYVRELLDCVLSSERAIAAGGGSSSSDSGTSSGNSSLDGLLAVHVRMALRLRLCGVAALPQCNALPLCLVSASAAVVQRTAPAQLLPAMQLAMSLDAATHLLLTRQTRRTTVADRAVLLSYLTQHTPSRLLVRALDALTRSAGDGGDGFCTSAVQRAHFLRPTVPYETLERAFTRVLFGLLRCRDDDNNNDDDDSDDGSSDADDAATTARTTATDVSEADALLRRPLATLAAYGVTRHDCVLVCLALTQQLRSRGFCEAEWLLFCCDVLARATRLLPRLPPLQQYTAARQLRAVVCAQACARRWLARRRVSALRRSGYVALSRALERVLAEQQGTEADEQRAHDRDDDDDDDDAPCNSRSNDSEVDDGGVSDALRQARRLHMRGGHDMASKRDNTPLAPRSEVSALFGETDRRIVQLTWDALGVDAQTRVVYQAVSHAGELAACDARFLRPSSDVLRTAFGSSACAFMCTTPLSIDDVTQSSSSSAVRGAVAATTTTMTTTATGAARDAQYALWSSCQSIAAHLTSLIRVLYSDKDDRNSTSSDTTTTTSKSRGGADERDGRDGWQMVWRVVYDGSIDVFFQNAVSAAHLTAFCVLLAECVSRALPLEQPRVRAAWSTFLTALCQLAQPSTM